LLSRCCHRMRRKRPSWPGSIEKYGVPGQVRTLIWVTHTSDSMKGSDFYLNKQQVAKSTLFDGNRSLDSSLGVSLPFVEKHKQDC